MFRQEQPFKRRHNFGSVDSQDQLVFGACRPGFPAQRVSPKEVEDWLDFMSAENVRRVVCLLASSNELKPYRRLRGGLLGRHQDFFGRENVLHAPIRDYHISHVENLAEILAFLRVGEERNGRTVVHCAGGSGRTGHVLAAWLVCSRGLDPHEALTMVRQTGRNPYEALHSGNASEEELISLLESARS